jgi:hypothetical protein
MALGQATDQQQDTAHKQKVEQQEKTPAKKKKARGMHEAAQSQNKSDTGANTRGGVTAQGHSTRSNQTDTRKTETKVNKEEFRSRHTEVYKLGRHPKEFFVQRYGANHVRLIGHTYFVFVDDCWVAVDVAGFTFVERTICPGDPDYIVVY